MKKSKLFVAALLCSLFVSVSTFANTPESDPNEIRTEIMNLVKQIDISDIDLDYERTYVQFIVNAKNEIVVVNVSSSDFDTKIKETLNYQKLRTEDVKQNEIYTVPVVFKKQ